MSLLLATLTAPRHLHSQSRSSLFRRAQSFSVLPSSHLRTHLPSTRAQSLPLICSTLAWIGACAAVVAVPSGRSTQARLIGGAHVHVSE